MEPPLTPEQKRQLTSWATQRDSILLSISEKRTEEEKLENSNKALAESNTEISDKIQQSIGRLLELDLREEARALLIRKDIVELTAEKTVLQTEVTRLKEDLNDLSVGKQDIFDDISNLMRINNTVFNNTTELEKVITDIVTKCSGNANEVSGILKLVEDKCKEILTLSGLNIEAHTLVLNEIPRLFVELKRKSLERDIIHKHKTHE